MTISFREYVLTHSPEDSPAGDFIMDSKHPSESLPDVKSWAELKMYLETHCAGLDAVDAAHVVWKRYLRAKDAIPVPLGMGLTVSQLIELLKQENPDAHVVKLHAAGKVKASRVLGFSRVSVRNGSRSENVIPAVMLEC